MRSHNDFAGDNDRKWHRLPPHEAPDIDSEQSRMLAPSKNIFQQAPLLKNKRERGSIYLVYFAITFIFITSFEVKSKAEEDKSSEQVLIK